MRFTFWTSKPHWMSLIHIGWDFWYERCIEIVLFGVGCSISFGVPKKYQNHDNTPAR